MTVTDLLSLGSLVLAILALYWSRKGEEANKNYQAVQEKLAQLELIRLTQKANILVTFSIEHTVHYRSLSTRGISNADQVVPESKTTRYLVIRNIGNVEARNIDLTFSSSSEDRVPHDLSDMEPIPILASGLDVAFPIWLAMGASITVVGKWKWENPDGTSDGKESYLLIPGH